MSRRMALALVALVPFVPTGREGRAAPPAPRVVAHCSWSYFGDPRAVVHVGHIYTGCIGTDGRSIVEHYELASRIRGSSSADPVT